MPFMGDSRNRGEVSGGRFFCFGIGVVSGDDSSVLVSHETEELSPSGKNARNKIKTGVKFLYKVVDKDSK